MITANYAIEMARYNAWQNRSHYREAGRLTDAQRHEDRGAFFGSLHATLAHILWGDRMWMSRFDGWDKPEKDAQYDWPALEAARKEADTRIRDWAAQLKDTDLGGDLEWHSGILAKSVTKPKWPLIVHFFNHQTHHRGQSHALLTSFGMSPDPTDFGFMPDDA